MVQEKREGEGEGREREGDRDEVGGEEERVIRLPEISAEEWAELKALTDREWAKVSLPVGWREFELAPTDPLYGLRTAFHRGRRLTVCFSVGRHDWRWWLHISVAHPDKLPEYWDLVEAKKVFIGEERQAVQVFPRRERHVNIHPNALHLWCSLEEEGDGLPDFGREGTI